MVAPDRYGVAVRDMPSVVGCDAAPPPLVGVEPSVDTVRYNGLARFEGQLAAVEVNVDDLWLERHEARHPGLEIGPGGALMLPDVVVAGQALVRVERLSLDRCQGRLVDVLPGDVPAGREARLVEHERAPRLGNDPVPVTHDEVS